MTQELQDKLNEVYDSLPGAVIQTEGEECKYINRKLLNLIVNNLVDAAVHKAKMESMNEFQDIIDQTFKVASWTK